MRPSRPLSFLSAVILLFALSACSPQSKLIDKVEAFRAARKAGKIEEAQRYLTDDPRVWFDAKEGEGEPTKLGFGPYHHWDEEFNSHGEHGPWRVEGNTVWAIASEINDYYRLLERKDTPSYRITYYFNDKGLIEGYLISDAHPGEPSPSSRAAKRSSRSGQRKPIPTSGTTLGPRARSIRRGPRRENARPAGGVASHRGIAAASGGRERREPKVSGGADEAPRSLFLPISAAGSTPARAVGRGPAPKRMACRVWPTSMSGCTPLPTNSRPSA